MSLTINTMEEMPDGRTLNYFTIVDGENTYKWHGISPLPDEAALIAMIKNKIAVHGQWKDTHPNFFPFETIAQKEAATAIAKELAENISFAEVDNHIDTVFGGLSTAQKTSLKKIYKAVLFLLKTAQ